MDNGASSYRRFLNGDKKAFEEIVKAYGDSLVCFAYCFVHDYDAAEDIAAETFAVLIIKKKVFKEDAKFKTYLFCIARNKCADYLRKARTAPLNDADKLFSGDGEEEFFLGEQKRQLYLSMQKLPPQYRDALYLTYIDGFTLSEVCRVMRKNKKQVYNLLARAKSALKDLLIGDDFYEKL